MLLSMDGRQDLVVENRDKMDERIHQTSFYPWISLLSMDD